MSEKFRENMSALVDGELESRSVSQTIDTLLESDQFKLHWSRYHMVRDVLRHKAYPDAGAELCERVRSCLADEPLHLPERRRLTQRWRATLKPVAGFALAASVAVVAVLAVRDQGALPGQPQRIAAPAPPLTTPSPLLAESTSRTMSALPRLAQAENSSGGLKRLQWNISEPAVANRLNGYLVNHSEYLGGAMKGMHPYARIVGYDSTGQR